VKVVVPKESRGLAFPKLFRVSMDEFDVQRLLPSLFFLVVTRGHKRGARVNKPDRLAEYVDELQRHERIRGFDGERGFRLLDSWIRTSIVRVGKAGKSRDTEKAEYLLPLTLLTYKAGWPDQQQRQRNVEEFLYRQLVTSLEQAAPEYNGRSTPQGERHAAALLDRIFVDTFGQGVTLEGGPTYDGGYDGQSEVDAETLLSLCFLDGLKPTPAKKQPLETGELPSLPGVAKGIATDVISYLVALRGSLPVSALTRGLMAIINLDLFIYTVKLAYGVDHLLRAGELPTAMLDIPAPSPPEIYVDFTRVRGTESDELARQCVERDLSQTRVFFEQIVLLRLLDRFSEDVPSMQDLKALSGPQYLLGLLKSRATLEVQARAQAEIGSIRTLTMAGFEDDETRRDEATEFFQRVASEADSVVACANLLSQSQSGTRVESLMKWFGSVGGLNRPFGLLKGVTRLRSGWRYQMTDDLLAALVQLAIIRHQSGTDEFRIPLDDFLTFLRERFGILVDRSPASFDSATSRAAAAVNLEAMKRRLRQMGFFADLSDDFSAQYLQIPLAMGEE
jgi:hypothetical protein